ncbi:MAG: acetylglutamate kinase [Bacteroidota bacterium]
MDKLTVVKIGGQVIDNTSDLKQFLSSFKALPGHKILVHGGGKKATEISKKLGIEPRMIDGRRITDGDTLEVVTMVYGGLVNKNIVAQLQAIGENAIGLSGADGDLIPATKRVHPTIDFGFVGDFEVANINTALLQSLLAQNITPVCCALTHDGQGNMLNTNADTLAAGLAQSLADQFETELVYCFEKSGVLTDIDDEGSLLSELSFATYQELKGTGKIADGMIPKLDNAFQAHEKGVGVIIKNALQLNETTGTQLI